MVCIFLMVSGEEGDRQKERSPKKNQVECERLIDIGITSVVGEAPTDCRELGF